jgi:hypothetical protein
MEYEIKPQCNTRMNFYYLLEIKCGGGGVYLWWCTCWSEVEGTYILYYSLASCGSAVFYLHPVLHQCSMYCTCSLICLHMENLRGLCTKRDACQKQGCNGNWNILLCILYILSLMLLGLHVLVFSKETQKLVMKMARDWFLIFFATDFCQHLTNFVGLGHYQPNKNRI